MRNAIILHGAGETPNSFWFPYVRRELENKGYKVSIPQFPDTDNPEINKWLPVALKEKYDEDTIIIGHSAGCPLILSVLENITTKVKRVILVAGYVTPLPEGANDILQKNYNWKKIKEHFREIIFINSDNDPWACDDKQGRTMFNNLGGTLIIRRSEGHMGSDRFNQPYKEFPFLLKFIE